MSKEQLNVASTEPVDLDESSDTKKSENSGDVTKENEPSTADKEEATPKVEADKEESKETKEEPKEEEEENLPPPPPRPVSPVTKMKNELKEAFPTVSERIITGILVASQGDLDQAFNACLYISDETIEEPEIIIKDPQVSSKPAVPKKSGPGDSGLTDDELLARQLQKEFEMEERRRRKKHQQKERRKFNQEADDSPDEFDDIKNTFNQGLEEARTTLNGWVSGLTKNFNGSNQDQQRLDQTHGGENPKLFGALGGSSFQRRNNNANKFDEDPKILPNDFHQKISLSNNEPDADEDNGPALPSRKPAADAPPAAGAGNTKNWQSLNSDVPVNSDAFIVTDSEDEDKKDTIKL